MRLGAPVSHREPATACQIRAPALLTVQFLLAPCKTTSSTHATNPYPPTHLATRVKKSVLSSRVGPLLSLTRSSRRDLSDTREGSIRGCSSRRAAWAGASRAHDKEGGAAGEVACWAKGSRERHSKLFKQTKFVWFVAVAVAVASVHKVAAT